MNFGLFFYFFQKLHSSFYLRKMLFLQSKFFWRSKKHQFFRWSGMSKNRVKNEGTRRGPPNLAKSHIWGRRIEIQKLVRALRGPDTAWQSYPAGPVALRASTLRGHSTYISDFLRVFDGCAPLFEVLKHLEKQWTAQFCLQNYRNG